MDEGWDTCNESEVGDGRKYKISLSLKKNEKLLCKYLSVPFNKLYGGKLFYAREFLLVDDLFIFLKKRKEKLKSLI